MGLAHKRYIPFLDGDVLGLSFVHARSLSKSGPWIVKVAICSGKGRLHVWVAREYSNSGELPVLGGDNHLI